MVVTDMLYKNKYCRSKELKVRVQKLFLAAATKSVTYSHLSKPSGYPGQLS